ncbi:unnamed protein product [Ixodes pacificus]
MLLSHFSEIKCPLAEILTAENRDPIEKDCSALLSQMVTDIVDMNDKEMLVGLLSGKNKVHHVMELTSLTPLRLQKHDLVANLDRETRALYDRMISKNLDEIVEIALVTRGQAAASRWMQERRIRITSTKAHRIKTRRTKFHELATSLTRPRTFSSAATSYGKD